MTWRDRLGLISVLVDGKRRVGTGFWVTPNRVLTARHVARDAPSLQIQPVTGGKLELPKEAILWRGEGALDAALIEAEHPDAAELSIFPFASAIRELCRCEAAGFPLIGYEAPHDDTIAGQVFDISGSLHPPTARRPTLQMSTEQDFTKMEQLGGISGGPVMVRDRLAGILRGGPGALNGAALHVVSIQSLLDVPEFVKYLDLPEVHDQCHQLEEKVRELLRKNSDLLLVLTPRVHEELGLPAKNFAEFDLEELGTNLLEKCEPQAVLRICTELIRQDREENGGRLFRLLDGLLGLLFPWSGYREFRLRQHAIKPGLTHLPFVEKAYAELVRAALEGRSMEFDSTPAEPFQARRAFATSALASGGSEKQRKRDAVSDLHQRMLSHESFFDRLLDADQKLSLEGFDADDQIEQRLIVVRDALNYKKEYEGEVYYLLVDHKTAREMSSSENTNSFFASLRDLLPDLDIVVMAGDAKQFGAENNTLLPLRMYFKTRSST